MNAENSAENSAELALVFLHCVISPDTKRRLYTRSVDRYGSFTLDLGPAKVGIEGSCCT